MFTQLPNLGLNVLQIHKGLRPLLLIPQKRRRVIDGGHLHAAPLEPLPMLLRDFEILLDDGLGGDPPQTDNDLRLHQRRLPPQIADAGVLLHVQRIPVLGRAALHHIGNIDLGAVQMDNLQHIVQQLTGPAHKGDALLILVLAGAFPDEHDLRSLRAVPKHHVGSGVCQRTAPAMGAVLLQRLPAVRHSDPAFRITGSTGNPPPVICFSEYTTPRSSLQVHKPNRPRRY